MKRFLLSLVALAITTVCFAQDVIVQKDGSTIQAKVLKVSQSEVEYKKFGNQEGPTYTINTRDLQCINYENGTKDTFVSANYNPNIKTNETATQFSNDKELLNLYKNRKTPEMLYKKGKRMKIAGCIVGGTLFTGGIVSMVLGVSHHKYYLEVLNAGNNNIITHYKYYDVHRGRLFCIGGAAMSGGVAVGFPLILRGSSLQNKNIGKIHAVSAISEDINFGNGTNFSLSLDLLSSDCLYEKAPGIGVRYNF